MMVVILAVRQFNLIFKIGTNKINKLTKNKNGIILDIKNSLKEGKNIIKL